jgi:transcriptional regulator GlxA family with amidase domain
VSGKNANHGYDLAMDVVAVLALDSTVAFDLAVPCQVFATARLGDGTRPYEVRVCADPGATATAYGQGCFQVRTPWDLEDAVHADTIVLPGYARCLDPPDPMLVELLREAAARGARLVSICTGAFLLAATGLLDGRRATTHWRFAAELARRHPRVQVDPAVLFIDNGPVLTSAGIAAGLDLCLHLVRRDHGATVAADAARYIVMPPQRDGGQAQFIAHDGAARAASSLSPTLEWLQRNLHQPLALTDIARHATTSIRSLNRHFRAEVGTTPLRWLLQARIHRAQQLLETTDLPVQQVAERVGFGSPLTLRTHFRRQVGTTPQAYRAAFRQRGPSSASDLTVLQG